MKIFTKIMLGLAGTLAVIGLVCFLAAFCMGFTIDGLVKMAQEGKFTFSSVGGEISVFEEDNFVGGESTEVIEQDCRNLEIKYDTGELEIYYGDVLDVQVEGKDVRELQITVGGDKGEETLYIEGGLDIGIVDDFDPKLVIILPYDMRFEHVDMKLGASQAKINGLMADEIEIEVGAGQADIADMNAGTLDIEVGAGEANITNLTVGNLKVEVGVGEANVQLLGAESYYNYKIECGIGEVIVGNNSYGGIGAQQNIKNPGANFNVEIECGIGQVEVQFTEIIVDEVTCDAIDCEDPTHRHNNHHDE